MAAEPKLFIRLHGPSMSACAKIICIAAAAARKVLFVLLLACCATPVIGCNHHSAGDEDEDACQEFWNVEIDEADAHASSNVELIMDEYMNPRESVKNISHEELVRLYRALRPVAAKAFASSGSRFEAMIRFSLWKDRPAHIDVRSNADEPEAQMLEEFRNKAAELTDFHPKVGKVWVMFDFKVSPRDGKITGRDYSAYELKDFPWRK